MQRLILVGSPREQGRCAALAAELFDACIEECPEDALAMIPLTTLEVAPCVGCNSCQEDGACVISDDMDEVREQLDAADELIVVCPVYFAGPPAQMKALIDRLQPYYWEQVAAGEAQAKAHAPKRPFTLHVVGEGGDPHGFAPLIGILRSAFSCAGFELEHIWNWVGKISEDGKISGDAEEWEVPKL